MNASHSIKMYHGLDYQCFIISFSTVSIIRCATTADYDRDEKWGNCVGVKCFKFVEQEKEYFEARSVCNNDQATLATINNEYEQGFKFFQTFYFFIIIFNLSVFNCITPKPNI